MPDTSTPHSLRMADRALCFVCLFVCVFVCLLAGVIRWPSPESHIPGSPHSSHPSPGGVATSPATHHHPHLGSPGSPLAGASPPPASPSHGHHGLGMGSPLSPASVSSASSSRSLTRAPHPHGPISPSSPRGLALNTRATEQAHRLQFVKKHIPHIIQLLYFFGPDGPGAAVPPSGVAPKLSKQVMSDLGFLMQCGSSTLTQVCMHSPFNHRWSSSLPSSCHPH